MVSEELERRLACRSPCLMYSKEMDKMDSGFSLQKKKVNLSNPDVLLFFLDTYFLAQIVVII